MSDAASWAEGMIAKVASLEAEKAVLQAENEALKNPPKDRPMPRRQVHPGLAEANGLPPKEHSYVWPRGR